MEMSAKQEDWKSAAVDANNLSELQLTLGHVANAADSGERGLAYADQSQDMFQRIARRANHAYVLYQLGQTGKALLLFAEAEQLQQEHQPEFPLLYSLPGFRYCDLLLNQGIMVKVL